MNRVFLETLGCRRSIFGVQAPRQGAAPTRHTLEKKRQECPKFVQNVHCVPYIRKPCRGARTQKMERLITNLAKF